MSETLRVTGLTDVAPSATFLLDIAPDRRKSTWTPAFFSAYTAASACRLAPLVSWVKACSASIGTSVLPISVLTYAVCAAK